MKNQVTSVPVSGTVDGFMDHMASRGYAASTARSRRSFVARFAASCDQLTRAKSGGRRSQCMTGELAPEHLVGFFADLRHTSHGNANNALSAVRVFSEYLELMSFVRPGTTQWLCAGRKMRRHERTPKHYIGVEDFPEALEAAGRFHPEDRMVIALAMFTLCRASEVEDLRLGNLDLASGTIQMFRRKRQRWTEAPVGPELRDELEAWLYCYARETGEFSVSGLLARHPDWYLCPARDTSGRARDERGRMLPGTAGSTLVPEQPKRLLDRVASRVLTEMGVTDVKGEGMHTLRRSAARALLDHLALSLGNDKALLQVAMMLDHEKTEMTLRYIGMDIERRQLHDWVRSNSMFGGFRPPPTVASKAGPMGQSSPLRLAR